MAGSNGDANSTKVIAGSAPVAPVADGLICCAIGSVSEANQVPLPLLVISRPAHACSAEMMVCLFGQPKRSCLDDVGWM